MGNKEYQEYFLNHKENDEDANFYIGTQDLIAKYGNELYSEETKVFISRTPPRLPPGEIPELDENYNNQSDEDYYNPRIPIVYNVIIDLQNGIANFPKLISASGVYRQKEIDKLPADVLEKARQWMKENKGNYIVNPNYLPSFNNATLAPYRNK
jgi:hypothetical protein